MARPGIGGMAELDRIRSERTAGRRRVDGAALPCAACAGGLRHQDGRRRPSCHARSATHDLLPARRRGHGRAPRDRSAPSARVAPPGAETTAPRLRAGVPPGASQKPLPMEARGSRLCRLPECRFPGRTRGRARGALGALLKDWQARCHGWRGRCWAALRNDLDLRYPCWQPC